jgi:hypothetical protein
MTDPAANIAAVTHCGTAASGGRRRRQAEVAVSSRRHLGDSDDEYRTFITEGTRTAKWAKYAPRPTPALCRWGSPLRTTTCSRL